MATDMRFFPLEELRCEGHGAGPSGHQVRVECVNCARRLAARPYGTKYMTPPAEFPCEAKIQERVDAE
jgi:hypothetical protein